MASSHVRRERFVDTQTCSLVEIPDLARRLVLSAQATTLQQARQYLKQDLRSNSDFRQLWAAAEAKVMEENGGQPKTDDDFAISLTAYTMELPKPLYKDLNEKSRNAGNSADAWTNFQYKGWLCMLQRALMNKSGQIQNKTPLARIPLYRGVDFNVKVSPEQFRGGVFFAFNQFTSTSTKEEVARDFTKGKGTLFEFDATPLFALDIKKYSAYPLEDEVLLLPWITFGIVGVVKEGGITRVKLTPQGPVAGYPLCN